MERDFGGKLIVLSAIASSGLFGTIWQDSVIFGLMVSAILLTIAMIFIE